jgi:GH15 family glucan-1,4-alpha-glucosidase
MSRTHNRAYTQLQATQTRQPRGSNVVPIGSWATNYYADGVAGSPTAYEIDETGFGIWTLWEHYRATEDQNYLFGYAYDAIQRAANYLEDGTCTDLFNDLPCEAPEEDDATPSQTIVGAQAAFMGLEAAVSAAKVLEHNENRTDWKARAQELAEAIHEEFYDPECKCYTRNYETGGTLLWPVRYLDSRACPPPGQPGFSDASGE